MPKPGQSPNIAAPIVSAMQGYSDAARVGMGSNQTPATVQTASRDPLRQKARNGPAGPSGKAKVEVSGIMEDQGRGSDTESTAYNYNFRKGIF